MTEAEEIFDKKAYWKEGNRDKLPEHAEQYLNRLRNFQDNLLSWAITWNIAFVAGLFYLIDKVNNNKPIYESIRGWFPWLTLVLNVCFIFLYLKSSYQGKNLSEQYLPDFDYKKCCIFKIKNKCIFVFLVLILQIIIFAISSMPIS